MANPVISNLNGDNPSYTSLGFGDELFVDLGQDVSVTDGDFTNYNGASVSFGLRSAPQGLEYVSLATDGTNEAGGITWANSTPGSALYYGGIASGIVIGSINKTTGGFSADGSNDMVITFNGNATLFHVEEVIKRIMVSTFSVGDEPDGDRTIGIQLTDPQGNSAAATSTVSVGPLNNPPVVDLNGGGAGQDNAVDFTFGTSPVKIAPNATALDADGDRIGSITITLTNRPDGASEGLSVSGLAIETLAALPGTPPDIVRADSITLNDLGASPQAIEEFLRVVTYENTAGTPTAGERSLTVVINDETEDSAPRTITVDVIPPPEATSTADRFDTTTGANLSPNLVFGDENETLTIDSSSHTTASVANGGGGTDTLIIGNGVNLTLLAELTDFEVLSIEAGATVTMNNSQHNGFTTFTDAVSQSITLRGGQDDVTGAASIETYNLAVTFGNTFTLGAAGQNVFGSDNFLATVDIGGFTVTGTLDGGAGSDVLVMGDGSDLSGATVTNFNDLSIRADASVSMTEAQHEAFFAQSITGVMTNQITITAADDGFATAGNIETYVLGAANEVTVGALTGHQGQSITGSTGNDTVVLSAAAYTGTFDGAGGTGDMLLLRNGTDVSQATLSGFEVFNLADGATVTLSVPQLAQASAAAFSAIGQQTVNVSGDGDFSTLDGVEIWSVEDDTTDTRTITVAQAGTDVSAISASDAVTFDVGTQTFTGTLTGAGVNDIVQVGNGANLAGATLTNVANLTVASGATVTLSEAQHDSFLSIGAAGTNTVVIADANDGFTADASIEAYALGAANSVTLGTSGGSLAQSVTGSSGNDTVQLGAAAYTGTVNGAGGTGDTLVLASGADISGATVSNTENLTLAADGSATLSAAQLGQFTGTGTVTATGTETVTLTGDGNVTTLDGIESWVVEDDSTNTRTITITGADMDVTADSATDAVTFDIGGLTYSGTITGDAAVTDVVRVGSNANLSSAELIDVGGLKLDAFAQVQLTAAQFAQLELQEIGAPGEEVISLVGDGDITLSESDVENFVIGDASTNARKITLDGGDSVKQVFALQATDAVEFILNDGDDFTGKLNGDATVADTLTVTASGSDIHQATLSGITNLTLTGALTLTTEQANAFSGTITAAGGSDTLAFTDSGTLTGPNLGAVEQLATSAGESQIIKMSAALADGKQLIAADSADDAFFVTGSAGNQTINGSAGSDTLDGGAGADAILSGAGTDSITGGAGADDIQGQASDLNGDTITDLEAGDRITLFGTRLNEANVRFDENSGALQIDTDNTSFASPEVTLFLSNTASEDLAFEVTNNGIDTSYITFSTANTAPVLSNLGSGLLYEEDQGFVVLESQITVSDAELDALNEGAGSYEGASLTLERSKGANTQDEFGGSGSLGSLVAEQTFTYEDEIVGFVNANGEGTLKLTFGSGATTEVVNGVLQSIAYANNSDTPDQVFALNWVFNDGTADSEVAVTGVDVDVLNDPAVIAGDTTGRIGEDAEPNTVSGTLTAEDPDGDNNSFVAVETETETSGGRGTYTLTADGKWTFTLDTDAVQSLGEGDSVQETFEVTSADGTSETVTIEIDGANDRPVFSAPEPDTFPVTGASVSVSLLEGGRDPDGDRLSASDLTIASDRRGEVAFTVTSAGAVVIPTAQFLGLALGAEERLTLSYTLSDGALSTAAQREIVVFGANRAPIAEDDRFFLAGASDALVGNLLAANGGAGDRDPDGDALRVVEVEGTRVPLFGDMRVELASGDAVTITSDGRFSFDPDTAAGPGARDVAFDYTIADTAGVRDTATVSIAIAPDPTEESGSTWQLGSDALTDDVTIEAFTPGGSVVFDLPTGGTGGVDVRETETGYVIEIDGDGDGETDGSITVEGSVEGGGFLVSTVGEGADARVVLDYTGDAPVVAESRALDAGAVNGVTSTAYLTGNGEKTPVITFDESTAALNSAVGAYIVRPDGTIVDAMLLFGNTNATETGARVTLDPLAEGELLGLFLVAGGAALPETALLEFEGSAGAPANAFADEVPTLLADGEAVTLDVFHAFSGLNEEGNRMVWSGYDSESGGLTIGFEDLALAVSDRDYNDVLIGLDFV